MTAIRLRMESFIIGRKNSPVSFNLSEINNADDGAKVNVISDLGRITRKLGFFTVHTGSTMKILPDGRNAHITQRPSSLWLQLCTYFNIKKLKSSETGFLVIVEPVNKR